MLNSERAPASVLLAVAVALLVASAFELIRIAPDGEAASAQMRENYEAVLTANQLAPNLASVRSNARGFVRSANLQDRADYEASVAALRKQVEDMGRLPARDAADTARLARIRSLAQGEIADLSAAVASHGQDGLAGAPSGGLDWRRPRMEALRAEVAAFSQDQRRRLANEAARFAGRQHRMKVRALLMALLGAGAAAAAVIMLVLRRRRAEDALARKTLELSAAELGARRAAAFLEGVGNATPDLIYAKDRERRFVYANPATLRVFGLPPEQVIGRRSAELVVRPDEIGEHDAADRRVIETGESEAVESAFTSPDGANRVYRSMKFPLHDGDGAVIGVAGLTIDVTEAHAIRQALADSEAKYRTIANAMPAIVWTATADGRRDFYNDRWYEFTAAPPGATDGWEWVKRIHRLDRRRVETHVRRRMAEGAPYEIEYRLVGREGTCWVLERALPLRGENGAIQRWEGTCTDIQELYESRHERGAAIADLKAREAHLQSILDSVPDPMIVIDDHGIIQSFSTAAEQQFGWTAKEAVGRNVDMLMPQPYRSAHGGYLSRYLVTGERRVIGIGRVVTGARRDGSTFPMELSIGETLSGERRFFTGFVRDLTERQEAERRFQDVQSELAHVSRLSAMGEMASALAHELNQPLTATASYLQGSMQLLDEAPIRTALMKSALTAANEQVLRAGGVIRRLREFVAKGETGRDTESLAQLLEEAGALAMLGAKDKGVRLTFDIPPDVDLVLVDKVQIQQVVLNLMRNAIEAMGEAPRRELTVSAREGPPDMVTVSVADTGAGIEQEILDRLFQPFVTSKSQGMGVGLSISRTIIEAHGGRIWAEKRPGGGTMFSFTLRTVAEEELQDVDDF